MNGEKFLVGLVVALLVGAGLLAGIFVSEGVKQAVVQENTCDVVVAEYRPLSKAISECQALAGCEVTVSDLRRLNEAAEDVAGLCPISVALEELS